MAMTTPWYVLLAASLVGGLATSIVNIVLQDRNARRLDRQRATDSEALEQLKAQLTTLTQLNSEGAKKRAEVAAEVLVGMLRMLDGLRSATSLGGFPTEEVPHDAPDRDRERVRRDVAAREASIEAYEDEFRHGWNLAEVFLPTEVSDLFARTHQLKAEIQVSQQMHAAYLEPKYGFFQKGFGPDPQNQLAEIRTAAKGLLQPLAQLAHLGGRSS